MAAVITSAYIRTLRVIVTHYADDTQFLISNSLHNLAHVYYIYIHWAHSKIQHVNWDRH